MEKTSSFIRLPVTAPRCPNDWGFTCVDITCFTFILFLGMTIKHLKGLRSFTNGNERKMLPREKQKSLVNVTNDVVTVTGVSVTLICICQKHMIRWRIPARHLIQRQSGFKTCDTHSARLHGNICFLVLAKEGLSQICCCEAASH